jgi:hypothetical protein
LTIDPSEEDAMEHESGGDSGKDRGGSDYGGDAGRDVGDEPAPSIRDAAPDYLSPIDASGRVSGHVPPRESAASVSESPEQDWGHARSLLYPVLRPAGTAGMRLDTVDPSTLAAASHSHAQPLIDEGPHGLVVVYAIHAGAFDVIVNGDHLLTWAIPPAEIRSAAFANLAAWSANAPWTDEVSGDRRLVSSDTGDGWDAVRILLPDVRAHLAGELASTGRVLVGVPERHLLVAGTLSAGDTEFAALFADFVVDQSSGADEPVDQRVFELVDGVLVPFTGATGASG